MPGWIPSALHEHRNTGHHPYLGKAAYLQRALREQRGCWEPNESWEEEEKNNLPNLLDLQLSCMPKGEAVSAGSSSTCAQEPQSSPSHTTHL